MKTRDLIITLFAALGFLLVWTTTPPACSAQGYCYQLPPVQAYTYPNYYVYSQPAPEPVGYYVASPAPGHYKHKHKHRKHKHKCKYKYEYEYY